MNVDSQETENDRKIGRTGGSSIGTIGLSAGVGMNTVARIQQEIPDDVGRLTLRQQNIDEVMSYGGLWQGREVATEIPAHVFFLRRDLFVRVAREYIEAAVIDEPPKPIDFVRGFLGTEANFDPLTATWLFLQSEIERVELEIELAMAVADLVLVQKLRPRQHPNGWEHC